MQELPTEATVYSCALYAHVYACTLYLCACLPCWVQSYYYRSGRGGGGGEDKNAECAYGCVTQCNMHLCVRLCVCVCERARVRARVCVLALCIFDDERGEGWYL